MPRRSRDSKNPRNNNSDLKKKKKIWLYKEDITTAIFVRNILILLGLEFLDFLVLIGFVFKYGVICKSSPVHRDIIFKKIYNIYIYIYS